MQPHYKLNRRYNQAIRKSIRRTNWTEQKKEEERAGASTSGASTSKWISLWWLTSIIFVIHFFGWIRPFIFNLKFIFGYRCCESSIASVACGAYTLLKLQLNFEMRCPIFQPKIYSTTRASILSLQGLGIGEALCYRLRSVEIRETFRESFAVTIRSMFLESWCTGCDELQPDISLRRQ